MLTTAVDVVVQAETECGQRSSVGSHSLGEHLKRHVFSCDGVLPLVEFCDGSCVHSFVVHLCQRVVGVACIAQRSEDVEGEVGCDVPFECCFDAHVFAADSAHGEIGEAVLLVVVEGGLFHSVGEECIVACDFGSHVSDAEAVGEFGAIDFL